MPLNRRLTISIGVIFAGLLLFWLFLQAIPQRRLDNSFATAAVLVQTATPVIQNGLLFPDVQPAAVTKITVRNSTTGKAITFTKVPGDWQATDEKGAAVPISAERLANLSRVVQIIGNLPYNRVIMDQSNLTTYGLAGDARLTIQFEAGTTHRLKIGTVAQVSGLTYLLRDDDSTIFLVPTQSLEVLSGLLAGAPP
jgi:hypothetical protein